MEGRRILVTGGAGFIGSHLVETLVAAGAEVRVLDNLSTGATRNLEGVAGEVELVRGDIRDPATCAAACAGRELVFHLAALGSVPRSLDDPATSLAINVAGTANLFAAALRAGVRRVVYASSSSVYGDSHSLPDREGREGRPLSPYAAGKKMNEETAAVFARCYELEVVGLRYFNVYGPRQSPDGPYAAVVPRFFEALLSGGQPTIYGDGEQSRDFTAVGDAVAANLLAAQAPGVSGRAYNVASGRRITILQLARAIATTVGREVEPRFAAARPADVRHSLADLGRARADLGYEPRTGLEEGLARALDFYRSRFAEVLPRAGRQRDAQR